MSLLSAQNVSRIYRRASLVGNHGQKRAVDGVSIEIHAGETVGLLGRSGCGKSSLARLLVGLEKPDTGTVSLEGRPIHNLSRSQLSLLRRSVQMVFQDSFSAVDPRSTVGDIIAEPLRHLLGLDRQMCRQKTSGLLTKVGLDPRDATKLPQQMSGGQLQRVCIARALAPEPRLIILDEAVSNLDLHLQIQILDLFEALQRDTKVAYLFVTHDLRLVERFCSRVVVMDKGRVCEEAPVTRPLLLSTEAGKALGNAVLPALPDRRRKTASPADSMTSTNSSEAGRLQMNV